MILLLKKNTTNAKEEDTLKAEKIEIHKIILTLPKKTFVCVFILPVHKQT